MINRIKDKIYALTFWQTNLGEYLNRLYDLKLFLKYSFKRGKLRHKENYIAFITKQYHIIEKGLALPEPRQNFGIAKISELLHVCNEYATKYPNEDNQLLETVSSALHTYLELNKSLDAVQPDLHKRIVDFCNKYKINNEGGIKEINLNDFKFTSFEEFAWSRTSVRNFSDEPVKFEDLKSAIDLARSTPSVCNRQPWKVHHYSQNEKVKKMLSLQDGNNGFQDSINQLLIITSDIQYFTDHEMNEVFVDGVELPTYLRQKVKQHF